MIIGLTGTNASGKTTIVNHLKNDGFKTFSLSDVIRDELITRKMEISRENLIRVGNELREKHGPAVLAERIKEEINISDDCVIDSIRNVQEVKALRELNGFFLISIDSPAEQRFKRAKGRGRIENVSNLEAFVAMENREKSSVLTQQNIAECMRQADYTIFNDGTIKKLQHKLADILDELQNRTRPSWDKYFMKMAFLVAERSTCLRHHVGAIIVKDKHVLTTGYNGAARNTDDCLTLGCLRNQLKIRSGERHEICRAIHAEQNAIIQAGVHGVTIEGATLFCTHRPCIICAKMIVNAGIKEVVTCDSYPDDYNLVLELFEQADVKFKTIKRPNLAISILP